MSASDDLESHSWPGFVDILSAAIMMFVFFVLITALALFIHVITYTSKEDPTAVLDVKQNEISELEIENRELRESLAGLQQKIKETESTFSESDLDQRLVFGDDGMSLVVFFGRTSITLTEESDKQIKDFLQRVKGRHSLTNLTLNLSASKTTSPIETIARKIAVARIFNVRNSFLESDLPREAIYLDVKEPSTIEDSYNWAKIQFEVKN